ncbi:MAG: glycopeptide antibiotics resistance protein, partial [Francisellaceae bacterium]
MRFLLITIILITYGSLYPLEFLSPNDITVQIRKLTNFRFWNSGISDAIANVFLFIPFGIAIQHTFKVRSFKVILALVAITFIFAFLVQISQIWTPKRIPYGGDAIWNAFGCIIGIKIYATSSQFLKTINLGIDWGRNLPLMVVASFIVMDLQPFIPTFDLGTINNNFKAVTSTQPLSVIEIV